MKASRAQMLISKQQKAILNILLYMLRESGMEEAQIQAIINEQEIPLHTAPIAPTKKPRLTALQVAEKEAEEQAALAEAKKKIALKPKKEATSDKPDGNSNEADEEHEKAELADANGWDDDTKQEDGEPNKLPDITNN